LWSASRQGGGAGLGKRRERASGRGGRGEVEGREREGPQVTVEPGPLRALLRHWLVQDFSADMAANLAQSSDKD